MKSLSLQARREMNLMILSQSLPSSDPNLYVIERRSYSRSNSDERLYKTKWWATLMRVYDCRCGLCGEDRDGIELDHFWIPKSHGGCFTMRLRSSGKLVNNAVPLCTRCNRQKQDDVVHLTDKQLVHLADANRRMSAVVNDDVVAEPAKLSGYQPGDERRAMGVPGHLREMAVLHKSHPSERTLAALRKDIEDYLMGRGL